jgi:putative transposase
MATVQGPFHAQPAVDRAEGRQEAVAALVRTVFAQPDHASAMGQLTKVAGVLAERFPKAADLLRDAAEDVLAYLHFPEEHRRRLHSTNPLEGGNDSLIWPQ